MHDLRKPALIGLLLVAALAPSSAHAHTSGGVATAGCSALTPATICSSGLHSHLGGDLVLGVSAAPTYVGRVASVVHGGPEGDHVRWCDILLGVKIACGTLGAPPLPGAFWYHYGKSYDLFAFTPGGFGVAGPAAWGAAVRHDPPP